MSEFGEGIASPNAREAYWMERARIWRERAMQLGWVGGGDDQERSTECEHEWVEYVQPIYKSVAAGDILRSGESTVKRYEDLGFMCDKCGKVKPPNTGGKP